MSTVQRQDICEWQRKSSQICQDAILGLKKSEAVARNLFELNTNLASRKKYIQESLDKAKTNFKIAKAEFDSMIEKSIELAKIVQTALHSLIKIRGMSMFFF